MEDDGECQRMKMITADGFLAHLRSREIDFFCGVPDSLLKSFCACLTETEAKNHIITANEGGAIGLAAGYYLATGKTAYVYMQNSGQGNAVNPLLALADPDVYSIQMVLLFGWRGEPSVHDEPHHVKQGKVTLSLFESLGIPVKVLPADEHGAFQTVDELVAIAKNESRPVALIIRKGTFAERGLANIRPDLSDLKCEDAIACCRAYCEAGANGIMIHSKAKTPDEVLSFVKRFRTKVSVDKPIVVVPSTYAQVTEDVLSSAGVNVVIYANHLLRAAYPAMKRCTEDILSNERAQKASQKHCMPIKDIVEMI